MQPLWILAMLGVAMVAWILHEMMHAFRGHVRGRGREVHRRRSPVSGPGRGSLRVHASDNRVPEPAFVGSVRDVGAPFS